MSDDWNFDNSKYSDGYYGRNRSWSNSEEQNAYLAGQHRRALEEEQKKEEADEQARQQAYQDEQLRIYLENRERKREERQQRREERREEKEENRYNEWQERLEEYSQQKDELNNELNELLERNANAEKQVNEANAKMRSYNEITQKFAKTFNLYSQSDFSFYALRWTTVLNSYLYSKGYSLTRICQIENDQIPREPDSKPVVHYNNNPKLYIHRALQYFPMNNKKEFCKKLLGNLIAYKDTPKRIALDIVELNNNTEGLKELRPDISDEEIQEAMQTINDPQELFKDIIIAAVETRTILSTTAYKYGDKYYYNPVLFYQFMKLQEIANTYKNWGHEEFEVEKKLQKYYSVQDINTGREIVNDYLTLLTKRNQDDTLANLDYDIREFANYSGNLTNDVFQFDIYAKQRHQIMNTYLQEIKMSSQDPWRQKEIDAMLEMMLSYVEYKNKQKELQLVKDKIDADDNDATGKKQAKAVEKKYKREEKTSEYNLHPEYNYGRVVYPNTGDYHWTLHQLEKEEKRYEKVDRKNERKKQGKGLFGLFSNHQNDVDDQDDFKF